MNRNGRGTGHSGARPGGTHVVGLGGTLRDGSRSLHAMEAALAAAEAAGASTERLALNELDLPLYRPGEPLDAYDPAVERMLDAVRRADAMIWSTGAYHGTLTGAMKNALDFLDFLGGDEPAYLDGRTIGLIAVAAGSGAGVNAINAMTHAAHALRAGVTSLSVPIPHASRVFDRQGRTTVDKWAGRLDRLGRLVVRRAGGSVKTAA